MKYILYDPNYRRFIHTYHAGRFEVTYQRKIAAEFDSVQAEDYANRLGKGWEVIPNNLP